VIANVANSATHSKKTICSWFNLGIDRPFGAFVVRRNKV